MNTVRNNDGGMRRRRRNNQQHQSNRSKLFPQQQQQQQQQQKNDKKTKSKQQSSQSQSSQSINSSLQRTKQMMQSELERVSHVHSSIETDGQKLQDTKETHLGMKESVKGAKGSLSLLKRQEREERVIFWCSVLFFYLVVLYVVWCRMRIPFLLW